MILVTRDDKYFHWLNCYSIKHKNIGVIYREVNNNYGLLKERMPCQECLKFSTDNHGAQIRLFYNSKNIHGLVKYLYNGISLSNV